MLLLLLAMLSTIFFVVVIVVLLMPSVGDAVVAAYPAVAVLAIVGM